MAITQEEKEIARAYNVGYVLSTYEPRLLEQIIKNNKDNEFVRTMTIAKDHHEFNIGLPRKDFTTDYKNGFFNARTLAEHEPELLDKMIASKDLDKDFVNGLKAGKKEYKVRETMARMKQEREIREIDRERDRGIEY